MAGVITPPVTLAETLGAKLRRLSRAAQGRNPIELPPWSLPPAWVASTAYTQGQVVSNGGYWFVNAIAGTSAGSGGPTNLTTGDAITDGTAGWSLLGAADAAAADAMAPTYSVTSSNPRFTTLPQVWDFGTGGGNWATGQVPTPPAPFRVYGGVAALETGTSVGLWPSVFDDASGSTVKGRGSSIAFMTDAPKFALRYTSGSPGFGVLIDGRSYSIGATAILSGTQWHIFDFTTVGGRKPRLVQVSGGKDSFTLMGVNTSNNDLVWTPPTQDDVRAVFISDSILAGSSYGPFLPGRMIPNIVGQLLGWSDPWNLSAGATGWISTAGGTKYTYGQRIAQGLALSPDLWVFMGSRNDIGQSSASITAAVLAGLQAVRAGSQAPIIVFGVPMGKTAGDASGTATVETAIAAGVTQFADPIGKSFFVPVQNDTPLPWITGTWSDGVRANLANAAFYIGGDNIHPVDGGTHYLAKRMAREVRIRVLPNLL